MIYEIIISTEAHDDLEGIYDYIANVLLLPKIAWNMIEKFYESIKSLETMPKRHKIIDNPYLTNDNIRSYQIKNYKIYYYVDESKKIVIILRITYYKMDLSNVFKTDNDKSC
ncbi:MAG: type II toxin-antitoxin system RelE/ParE family toxin [bacterium]|nr:type II toxin-antitoxin system RelE/ParE family toxin [bacterium]